MTSELLKACQAALDQTLENPSSDPAEHEFEMNAGAQLLSALERLGVQVDLNGNIIR